MPARAAVNEEFLLNRTLLAIPLFIVLPPIFAQDPAPAVVAEEPVYVRRFSLGGTFTVQGLGLLRGGALTTTSTDPVLETQSNTQAKAHRYGGGVAMQILLTEHVALNLGLLYRKVEYVADTAYLAGVDNPNTIIDERQITTISEWTRSTLFDLPLLVRYYKKSRYDPGGRWFVELGGTVRDVRRIRTNRETISATGVLTADNNPAQPSNIRAPGATAGIGMQFIDPVGIRVIPQVRYTRWLGSTFDSLSTRSNRNQVEFLISFTF
jgi:hypothetical protein